MRETIRFETPAETLSAGYASARPFPHVVIDGLFEERVIDALLAEFPSPDADVWRRFENDQERKLGYDYRAQLGPALDGFLSFMNSPPALEFVEQVTGIDGLIPDPYYGGAGLHQIPRGGFLKIHADFNVHPKLRVDRRVNLLLYLNRDWRDEYGGHLELWSEDMSRCEQRIAPVANRTVIFSTTSTSYHGHPEPLTCPEGQTRRSMSLYYYTVGRPNDERQPEHDTIFRERPGDS